jgi:hypothetical protein
MHMQNAHLEVSKLPPAKCMQLDPAKAGALI